jgi:hypothetical protein
MRRRPYGGTVVSDRSREEPIMKVQRRNQVHPSSHARIEPEAVVALAFGVPNLDRSRTIDS